MMKVKMLMNVNVNEMLTYVFTNDLDLGIAWLQIFIPQIFDNCKCYLVPWLITTSCLISHFQISGPRSKTLSAQDLNFRPRILLFGQGFESAFEDQSTNPRPTFLEADMRPRVSSNLVLKLIREKKTNIVNRHQQITTSCLVSEFQMSGRTS